jgi:hypothetical protein
MATFKVKTHVKHDDNTYEPGDIIELTSKQAKAMPWAVEPAPGAKPTTKVKDGASEESTGEKK